MYPNCSKEISQVFNKSGVSVSLEEHLIYPFTFRFHIRKTTKKSVQNPPFKSKNSFGTFTLSRMSLRHEFIHQIWYQSLGYSLVAVASPTQTQTLDSKKMSFSFNKN